MSSQTKFEPLPSHAALPELTAVVVVAAVDLDKATTVEHKAIETNDSRLARIEASLNKLVEKQYEDAQRLTIQYNVYYGGRLIGVGSWDRAPRNGTVADFRKHLKQHPDYKYQIYPTHERLDLDDDGRFVPRERVELTDDVRLDDNSSYVIYMSYISNCVIL